MACKNILRNQAPSRKAGLRTREQYLRLDLVSIGSVEIVMGQIDDSFVGTADGFGVAYFLVVARVHQLVDNVGSLAGATVTPEVRRKSI
jgi:hypothetical protein